MDREKQTKECEELEAPFAFVDFSKPLAELPIALSARKKDHGQFRPAFLDA